MIHKKTVGLLVKCTYPTSPSLRGRGGGGGIHVPENECIIFNASIFGQKPYVFDISLILEDEGRGRVEGERRVC